jgi:hypothetical protein
MRRILIIALALVSIGAVAGVQPAAAGLNCTQTCTSFGDWIQTGRGTHRQCLQWGKVCTGTNTQGPGPVQPIQNQKLKNRL